MPEKIYREISKQYQMWQDQVIVKIIDLLSAEKVMIYEVDEILEQTKLVAQQHSVDRAIPKWIPLRSNVAEDSEKQPESPAPAEPLSVA